MHPSPAAHRKPPLKGGSRVRLLLASRKTLSPAFIWHSYRRSPLPCGRDTLPVLLAKNGQESQPISGLRISLSCFSHPLYLCKNSARTYMQIACQLSFYALKKHRLHRRGALYSAFHSFVSRGFSKPLQSIIESYAETHKEDPFTKRTGKHQRPVSND